MDRLELKKKFYDFFRERKYHICESAPLVPVKEIDLDEFKLTFRASIGSNFIIHKLKNGFSPFAIIQHAFRYHDYPRVGDGLHLALFEMAGAAARLSKENKRKNILDALFFLEAIGIPKEKLWASYFAGGEVKSKLVKTQNFPSDDDSLELFKTFGLPSNRIIGCKADVAFVGLTQEDPYGGPRAHIYFDRGEQFSCSAGCVPEHSEFCHRFIEIGVFITEHLDKKSVNYEDSLFQFIPMKYQVPYVVMGLGIERILWIINQCDSIYSVDPIQRIIVFVKSLCNTNSIDSVEIVKLTEYLKTAIFLIGEGGKPGNRSNRRRQLRKILFDLFRLTKYFNIDDDKIILSLINRIIFIYQDYPSLLEKQYIVLDMIKQSKSRVLRTL